MLKRIFIDTAYVIALINQNDQYHEQATILAKQFEDFSFLTTDAILLEIGNALARSFKPAAIEVLKDFQDSPNVEIVHLNPLLFQKSLEMYQAYQDKTWGLVDCISFIIMREAEITDVLTFDHHFEQAGFQILNEVT